MAILLIPYIIVAYIVFDKVLRTVEKDKGFDF